MVENHIFFEVPTPIGCRIQMTISSWEFIITVKHPVMRGCEEDVENTLREPDEIRRSRSDPNVYLFYRAKRLGRWICVVARRLNEEGFVITTYPTDNIKEGERIWSK
ncbi:MAG: DUF4258 domain-containing protein [Candidatus Latescibacteria bacterium]|nr:DUF4258 domain-containing protein [Candidatus Latescibacterota bacterium]